MKLNETRINCPRCRSKQKFIPRREYGSDVNKFTVYIECKKCHKKIDLYESTSEIEDIKKVLKRLKREVDVKPTHGSLNLLAKLKKRLYNLERSLSEE